MASVSPIMTDKDVAKFFGTSVRTLARRLDKPLAGEIDPNLGNPRKIGGRCIVCARTWNEWAGSREEIKMTLNEIIMRDLAARRRWEEMDAVQRELDEYEREIKRRLWRRRIKLAFDMLAEVAFVALLLVTVTGAFLWCAAHIF